jgi:hypothetical protein
MRTVIGNFKSDDVGSGRSVRLQNGPTKGMRSRISSTANNVIAREQLRAQQEEKDGRKQYWTFHFDTLIVDFSWQMFVRRSWLTARSAVIDKWMERPVIDLYLPDADKKR